MDGQVQPRIYNKEAVSNMGMEAPREQNEGVQISLWFLFCFEGYLVREMIYL